MNRPVAAERGGMTARALAALLPLVGGLLLVVVGLSVAGAADTPNNVGMQLMPREILFFSAQAGTWTSVRLDAGERVLKSGADTNVAAILTSQRAIGFSAVLNVTHEIRLTEDEGLEAFQVRGNIATALTRRRALGFSAATGRWSEAERFQLGR
jgi:hypothetical protein